MTAGKTRCTVPRRGDITGHQLRVWSSYRYLSFLFACFPARLNRSIRNQKLENLLLPTIVNNGVRWVML